jgi:hypothetical protein
MVASARSALREGIVLLEFEKQSPEAKSSRRLHFTEDESGLVLSEFELHLSRRGMQVYLLFVPTADRGPSSPTQAQQLHLRTNPSYP